MLSLTLTPLFRIVWSVGHPPFAFNCARHAGCADLSRKPEPVHAVKALVAAESGEQRRFSCNQKGVWNLRRDQAVHHWKQKKFCAGDVIADELGLGVRPKINLDDVIMYEIRRGKTWSMIWFNLWYGMTYSIV